MSEAQGEKKQGRTKKVTSGGWNWLKSKRGSNALLATIAGAVATGLAVAGIVVPLNDLKQRITTAALTTIPTVFSAPPVTISPCWPGSTPPSRS